MKNFSSLLSGATTIALFLSLYVAIPACKPARSEEADNTAEQLADSEGAESQGFLASKACEAYQSKNKKTNPGNIKTKTGSSYEFVEFNRGQNPDWVRIKVPNAKPAERWVEMNCGKMTGTANVSSDDSKTDSSDQASDQEEEGSSCQLAGGADDYTFAVSWQPAFCELKSNKRECKIRDPQVYQANNFTLHGLWPNKSSCGTNYGYCKGPKKSGDFCEYDEVALTSQLKKNLSRVMPSVAAGSCLERYEWYKHGLCQKTWSAEQYFAISVRLTEEFNAAVAPAISGNVGKTIQESDFFQAIDQSLGPDAHKRLQLKCQKGDLIDIYIKLPKDISSDSTLRALIQKARPGFRSNCGGKFAIDEIND